MANFPKYEGAELGDAKENRSELGRSGAVMLTLQTIRIGGIYTSLHLVGSLDRKKLQVPPEQEQQHSKDEDEVFSFVSFLV